MSNVSADRRRIHAKTAKQLQRFYERSAMTMTP